MLRRLCLPCVVTLGLGYVAAAINVQLWRVFAVPFDRWQVSSLPFYAVWAVFGLVVSLAMPAIAGVPWWSRRRDVLAYAIVIAGAALMYLPSLLQVAQLHMPVSVLYLLAGGVAAPVVEEWIFRGLLWNAIARVMTTQRLGPILTIAITSLVFGFFHMSFEGHSWRAFGNAFVHAAFGALMGFARWRLGGIAFGCAIHAAGNSLWILTAS